jgi:hypothetical protein
LLSNTAQKLEVWNRTFCLATVAQPIYNDSCTSIVGAISTKKWFACEHKPDLFARSIELLYSFQRQLEYIPNKEPVYFGVRLGYNFPSKANRSDSSIKSQHGTHQR